MAQEKQILHEHEELARTVSRMAHEIIEKSVNERFRWVDELVEGLNAEECAKVTEALTILTGASQNLEERPK